MFKHLITAIACAIIFVIIGFNLDATSAVSERVACFIALALALYHLVMTSTDAHK